MLLMFDTSRSEAVLVPGVALRDTWPHLCCWPSGKVDQEALLMVLRLAEREILEAGAECVIWLP